MPASTATKNAKTTAPKISEVVIERTCSDYLALDGWRLLKTNPCSDRRRGKGFGELGMADCLYIRYQDRRTVRELKPVIYLADAMWIEWKSPRGLPKPHQIAWHMAERARGALTLIAGQDFPATIEGFQQWYRQSGLMHRPI